MLNRLIILEISFNVFELSVYIFFVSFNLILLWAYDFFVYLLDILA